MNDKSRPKGLPQLNAPDLHTAVNFVTDRHWGVTDPIKFKALMTEVLKTVSPPYFLSDNVFSWVRNNSALEDRPFREAWESNLRGTSDAGIPWRRYILACAGYHALHLQGDFVECGAYLGSGVKTVIDYLGAEQFAKTFWVYDTFDYHPVAGRKFAQQQEGLFDKVQERFQNYPQVKLIRGLLPSSLTEHGPSKISYLHLDLNSLHGELAVLEVVFDRIVPGGIIVLDDYEWAGSYREQKIGEASWFDHRSYRVFPLPTGQGIVIKR